MTALRQYLHYCRTLWPHLVEGGAFLPYGPLVGQSCLYMLDEVLLIIWNCITPTNL